MSFKVLCYYITARRQVSRAHHHTALQKPLLAEGLDSMLSFKGTARRYITGAFQKFSRGASGFCKDLILIVLVKFIFTIFKAILENK